MPDALKLPFAGEEVIRKLSAGADEPDWLLSRPTRGRPALHRPARRDEQPVHAVRRPARGALGGHRAVHGDGRRGRKSATSFRRARPRSSRSPRTASWHARMSTDARAAGVVIDTFANVLRDKPELLRELIDGGPNLPDDDKFAQFARSHSALGLVVHVPRNVVLERPIVVRWSAGAPGRGLVVAHRRSASARTPQAQILEEQVGSEAHAAADEKQSLWWGTSEVRLARGAHLSFAGQQDFGPNTIAIVNRHATLDQDAQLRWALASVGAQLHKSRIDNQLVGRGSSRQPGRDRLRRRPAAVRPDQLHAPHRPGHDRRPALQGRLPRPCPRLHQGHDRHPAHGPRARTASWASSRCCSPSRRAA